MKGYIPKLLLGIDIFFCMLLFRDPDVTISSETGLVVQRTKPPLWAKLLHRFLNAIEKDHCELAIKNDILRAQIAITYLETKQP